MHEEIKPLGAKQRTNNKFTSHMVSTPRFECEQHCLLPAFLQRFQKLFLHMICQSFQIAQTHDKKRHISCIYFSQRTEGEIINLIRFP